MVEEKREVMYCIERGITYLYITTYCAQTMFGRAWCLKGTCDIIEAAIKAPSIRVSGLLVSVIWMVTMELVDTVDQVLRARSTDM